MARTQIPPGVFIILGIIVVVISYLANKRTEGKFILFILFGAILITYGIGKAFLNKTLKKERIEIKHIEKKGQMSQTVQNKPMQKQNIEHFKRENVTGIAPQEWQQNQEARRETYTQLPKKSFRDLYCLNCGNRMEIGDNFCSRCGIRFR